MLIQGLEIVALGREDFLAAFKLEIDQRAASFSLELYSESSADWIERIGGPNHAPSRLRP